MIAMFQWKSQYVEHILKSHFNPNKDAFVFSNLNEETTNPEKCCDTLYGC